jgi:catechol 2,3-dioxygenase-like lactoylglutathione lyase family enzyme
MRIAGMSHVALTVTDLEAARTFWTAVMGFTVAMESPGLVILVEARARVLVACVTHEAGDRDPFDERRVGLDHVAFEVDSIEQLRAWEGRLTELGVPPEPIVESPFGSHLNLRGPENLAIELLVMAPTVRAAMFGQDGTA